MASDEARYLVGIDLGTTNCAVAYADTAGENIPISIFRVPQLVDPGVVADRDLLPSCMYLAAGHEIPEGGLDLPWARRRDFAVGLLARTLGGRAPGRLITSAKSWLCHGRVRRTQPILPWGAEDGVPTRSPVAVQAAYLTHMREAWDAAHGPHILARQAIILTVPASFDEVARHLTLAAAKLAGLENVSLIEEPQAAFYTYLSAHEQVWRETISPGETVLVCDVGGGTTDFSLIRVVQGRIGPVFRRLAVGDHILLGGDNMDLAIARLAERKLGGAPLDMASFSTLLAQVRDAKEQLLSPRGPQSVPVTVYGRGRSIVGGTRTCALERDEVRAMLLERFFPAEGLDEEPALPENRATEFGGLPYAADEAVTRHLAAFLHRHGGEDGADSLAHVLFNGGVMVPPMLQEAVLDAASRMARRPLAILPTEGLFLAVARGAAYYGRTRHGLGLRIQAGSPRTYYVGVATPTGEKALCVMPRGAAEEGAAAFTAPEIFHVAANSPVGFTLYSASSRDDPPGEMFDTADLAALPPVRTILRYGKRGSRVDVPIKIRAELSEIGTLDLWCEAIGGEHRWRLEFALDEAGKVPDSGGAPQETVAQEVLDTAAGAIRACFAAGSGADPAQLVRELERLTDSARDAWSTALLRGLWDALNERPEGRTLSALHEGRWLNLCGYLLRPGFGDPLDSWRMGRMWRLFGKGPVFRDRVESRVEWWILWRRLAAGLDAHKQEEVYGHLHALLLKPKGAPPAPQEAREMWRAAAALELLPAKRRIELGNEVMARIEGGRLAQGEVFALARIGAREPLHAPVDTVLPGKIVEGWLRRLLGLRWEKGFRPEFALLHLARFTGDRARDLSGELREEVAERVARLPHGEELAQGLFRVTALTAREEQKVFGDALPLGLKLAQ